MFTMGFCLWSLVFHSFFLTVLLQSPFVFNVFSWICPLVFPYLSPGLPDFIGFPMVSLHLCFLRFSIRFPSLSLAALVLLPVCHWILSILLLFHHFFFECSLIDVVFFLDFNWLSFIFLSVTLLRTGQRLPCMCVASFFRGVFAGLSV